MDVTPSTVVSKTERKTRKQGTPLPRNTAHGAKLNPVEVGALHQESAAFDPHVFLTKLATGKNSREYKMMSPSSRKGTQRMRCSTSRVAG